MKAFSVAILLTLAVGACGNSVPPDTLYDDGSQNGPGCPFAPTYTGQVGGTGDPCSNAAADCSPSCCECAAGNDSYYASECSGGFCTDGTTACNDAQSSTLCD